MHINASARVVERLLQHLGLSTVRELMEYLHIDVYDTRGMDLHSGTAPIYIGSGKGDKKSPDHPLLKPGKSWGGNIMSLWNIREYEKDSIHGPVLEIENPLLTDPSDWEQWENYLWPSVSWFDYSEINADLLKWSEFSIMASGASVFQHGSYIRGLDAQLMDLLMAPDKAEYLLDKLFDFYFDYYSKLFASCGEQIDVFALADDFGTQNSLMISEALFDQYFASRIKKLADLAHKHDIFLLLHTCGNIEPLIPSFIDLGVDVLDPVQPESMDVVQIKKKYGKDICLRGGISSQKVLAHGSKEDVQQEVKEKLDILMPGGGYIFSPGHPVFQVDIPTENIVTMYETAWGVNGEK
jgi:uroporphyrinogen decarboxylase